MNSTTPHWRICLRSPDDTGSITMGDVIEMNKDALIAFAGLAFGQDLKSI